MRFVYSYLAVYGDPLVNPELDPYPDGFLQRLSAVGVNGVWLHAVLRDLAPGGTAFPEFGDDHEKRLASLASTGRTGQEIRHRRLSLHERAAGDAERVFQCIARRWPASAKDEFTAMCTSHPAVRRWMADALAYVFQQVPDLGGIYAITASENLTNCASHGNWRTCQRCKDRTDAEIIAEVAAVLEEGVHRGAPRPR